MPPIGEVVARRVRHYRDQSGLTQQQLAERTKELGHPISRGTLAKIEAASSPDAPSELRTRVENITLVDVLVLAAALDTSPLLLFLPLGEEEDVVVTPGVAMHPQLAIEWARGDETFTRQFELDGKLTPVSAPWNGRQWRKNVHVLRLFDQLRSLQDAATGSLATDADRLRLLDHLGDIEAAGYDAPIIPGVNDGER
jgi:transcriptional regulator with XRE-family HTH domain